MSDAEKSGSVLNIVELLLIGLLLVCNCLNLVSVLGFNALQVRPIADLFFKNDSDQDPNHFQNTEVVENPME